MVSQIYISLYFIYIHVNKEIHVDTDKYLLNHKEQHSPGINKTTPERITFLPDLVKDHNDPLLCNCRSGLCQ